MDFTCTYIFIPPHRSYIIIKYMPYFRIVGAGSVELSPFRYASGLIVSDDVYHLAIDITPRNSFGLVKLLHDRRCAFAVTHGHGDHFDPEIPWREIFDYRFAEFGNISSERVLFAHSSTLRYLLKYNGLYSPRFLDATYRQITLNGIRIIKAQNVVKISNKKRKSVLKVVLLKCVDRCMRSTESKGHGAKVRIGRAYRWGRIRFVAFNAHHPWNIPPSPPYIVKNGITIGFFFIEPFVGVYLPDFSLTTQLRETLLFLVKRFGLQYFIVGMTNPIPLETDSPHANVDEVLEFCNTLRSVSSDFITIFTHRNPNWEKFKVDSSWDVHLADNGEVFSV